MKKHLSALFVSLLALAGCMQETISSEGSIDSSKKYNTTVSATMENDDTRSTVDAKGGFTWASGDEVSVWVTDADGNGSSSTFILDDAYAGGKTGLFNGFVPDGSQIAGYAIYPASDLHVVHDEELITVCLPSEYGDFETDYIPNTHAIMVAKTSEESTKVQSLSFRHLAGVLRISLENVPAGAAQLVLTTESAVTGLFKFKTSSEEPVIRTWDSDGTDSVTIKFRPLTAVNEEEMQFFFPLPVGEYKGFAVSLQDKDGNELWGREVTRTNRITRRTLSVLPTVTCPDIEEEPVDLQREALIALYNSTDGDNWTNNENWCSDLPISEWYGVSAYNGTVYDLYLEENNLCGTIPPEIGNLTSLEWLYMYENKLTGPIPAEMGNLTMLEDFQLFGNELSGVIPEEVTMLDGWGYSWPNVIVQNGEGFDLTDTYIPAPVQDLTINDIDGNPFSFADVYSENEYTILLDWASWCPYSQELISKFLKLYDTYKANGVEIIGVSSDYFYNTAEDALSYINDRKIPWKNVMLNNDWWFYYPMPMAFPSIMVVKDNAVVFQSFTQNYSGVLTFFENLFGIEDYVSTDYSADGAVTVLQEAAVGNGIDIVLMGDAYSDRLIADGTYEEVMRKAADFLFVEEPYKTYRDMFNVYMVNVVSKNEEVGMDTALDTYFGDGTLVGGNDEKCKEYALKAITKDRMNDAMIVVMQNSFNYAGTCWMYYGGGVGNDYGSGLSISYFPIGIDDEAFREVLNHEACGHGFAKLDDEYAYEYYGAIPAYEADELTSMFNTYGWNKNVDVTNDLTQIRWHHFLEDSRYANEGLGAFEGGSTYWTGVWRPTENSIMRHNTGGFNAPSREAIYYRIHKLAYGADWEYDYEAFVEYDSINRTQSAVEMRKAKSAQRRLSNFVPLAPPVIIPHAWDE